MNESLTCEQLVRCLSDYIDNELDQELTAAAQAHLSRCHHCRILLDTTQKTIYLFRTYYQQIIAAERRTRIFSRLKGALNITDEQGAAPD